MRFNIKALAFTTAICWGGSILITGLANLIWTTYGVAFLEAVASLYGLVDGFVAGLIFGWLYNLFAARGSLREA